MKSLFAYVLLTGGLCFLLISPSFGTSQTSQPTIQFNREVIQDVIKATLPLDAPAHVYISDFPRLLNQPRASIPNNLLNSSRYNIKSLKLKNGIEILNITTKLPVKFNRGIYIIKNNIIIGYALSGELQLFLEKKPKFLNDIDLFPVNNLIFKKYIQTPRFGHLDLYEKKIGNYVEQYALYEDPSGKNSSEDFNSKTLLLDAFYPQELKKYLEKPLSRAIARHMRFYERWWVFYTQKIEPPLDSLDMSDDIGPEMDDE